MPCSTPPQTTGRPCGRSASCAPALVYHGVLEPRDEPSAAFDRWHHRALQQISPGPDLAHLRAYATWHVAHELARKTRRASSTPGAQKYARSLVNEAIKLVRWLHDQQLELRDLRQDLIDTWIATGASTRRRVRLFLAWLARAGVTGRLHVAWDQPGPRRAPHQPLVNAADPWPRLPNSPRCELSTAFAHESKRLDRRGRAVDKDDQASGVGRAREMLGLARHAIGRRPRAGFRLAGSPLVPVWLRLCSRHLIPIARSTRTPL